MSEVKKPREWTLAGSSLGDYQILDGDKIRFNEMVRVKEVSEAEDAAVEGMRKALEYYGHRMGMGGTAREALEAYELARSGKGD